VDHVRVVQSGRIPALYIENWTDLPVVNRTAVSGLFAVETGGWAPLRLPPPPPDNPPAVRFDDLPTIFAVLRKLGLELKQQEAAVSVYTVEHIESRPGKKSLTLASPLGSLQPMRGPFRTGATVRPAVISERTVSRYLHGRPPKRSQTWRTFFANHLVTSARQHDRQPR